MYVLNNWNQTIETLSLTIISGFESSDGSPLLKMTLWDFCDIAKRGIWKHCAFVAVKIDKKLAPFYKQLKNGADVPAHIKKDCEVDLSSILI